VRWVKKKQKRRRPIKLITERCYYLTHLVSTIAFIENLKAQCLKIDPEQFHRLMNGTASDNSFPSKYTPSSHLQFLSDSDYGTDLMDSLFLDPEDDDEYDFYRSLETEIKMVYNRSMPLKITSKGTNSHI